MANLRIATWNVFQYAKVGTYWYDLDESKDYEEDQWAAKHAWMKDIIDEMDADIIGFQEIFSVQEFTAFINTQGYPHVAVVDKPAIDPSDSRIYVGPVTAIASRHPFISTPTALIYPQELRENTQLQDDYDFRRAIVRAEIDTPQFGSLVVYVCHFKSKGTFVDGDEIAKLESWKDRFREHLRARATNDADQLIRRSGEAAGVYLAAMEELESDKNRPLVVIGDFNDDENSTTLRILTQQERVYNIARKRRRSIESAEDKAWNFTWQLYDSYGLVPNQSPALRPVTHAGGWDYDAATLDFVLVSNGLNPKNPERVGEVNDFNVYSDHFEDLKKLLTTDHAPVCVTISPVTS